MGRAVPWRSQCPPSVLAKIEAIFASPQFLLVQQNGPASFVLKETSETTQRKFKVRIGELQECSCAESKGELCAHILFVMARVFRVPNTNPVLWQRALLESEVEQLVSGRMSIVASSRRRPTATSAESEQPVERRLVSEGDSCPICCDNIDPRDGKPLVYCRYGCGNNIHSLCFSHYVKFNATSPRPLECPLCRAKWGPLVQGSVLHGVSCSVCRIPIAGERFRCAFCASYNLCRKCFDDPSIHGHHPFDVCEHPGEGFRHSQRVMTTMIHNDAAPLSTGAIDPLHIELMGRELGPEDYDRLLHLDDDVARPAGTLLSEGDVTHLHRVCWDPATSEYESCAICMENFSQGESCVIFRESCNHIFHSACALRWLTQCRAVCPIDNIPVVVSPVNRKPDALSVNRKTGALSVAPSAVNHRNATNQRRGPRAPRRAELCRGRPTLNHLGNVTEGSFRPTAEGLAGLIVESISLGGIDALTGLAPHVGHHLGPVVPARLHRLHHPVSRHLR